MFRFISTVVILFAFTRVAAGSVLRDGQGSDVTKLFVKEPDDVILPCSPQPNMNIEATVFDWKKDKKEMFLFDSSNYFGNGRADQDKDFKGRVSHFVDELKYGNASILLRDTRTTDSGNYTCSFPRLGAGQTHRIELVVGVALPPYVKIRNVTGDGVLLECFVRDAYPQPEVEWQTSDGSVVPAEEPHVSHRGHRFDVLLLTTVKKTNMYHCVVKQKGFGHVIHNELFVPDNLFEDKPCTSTSVALPPYFKIRNVTVDGVLLECFVPDNLFEDKSSTSTNNLFEDKPCTSTSGPMVAIITLIVALIIALLVIAVLVKMNQRKKLLKCWSRGREAEPDAAEAEAVELQSQLPYSDAKPDEAEAEAGHQLSNGSGSTQTTL